MTRFSPHSPTRWRNAARVLLVAALAVAACALPSAPSDAAPPLPKNTSAFRGVNWADPRDNYAHDAVVPSGLDPQADYATNYRIASGIIGEFRKELRANTVRLPINPSSVGTDWWTKYRAAIDAATDSGFTVILSYWEADTSKDGRIDDPVAWAQMWRTVDAAYAKNPKVLFEAMNEPHGYSLGEWVDINAQFIADHPSVPRSRIVVSGTGYNDSVQGVCAAPELSGTLLSLHFYGFWGNDTTEQKWLENLTPRLQGCESRTIVDEAGSPMTIGLNYGNHEGNVSTAYLGALTQYVREHQMGLVYWPGLRNGDSYSMTTLVGESDLEVNSASGLAQLQWGWGLLKQEPVNTDPASPPGDPLRVADGGRCLDVPGWSTTPGEALDLWDCNGGGNQSWNLTDAGELTVYASLCLTAGEGAATADRCTGAANQHWTIQPDSTVVSGTGLCLTATGPGNGAAVVAAACTGASNQQWSRA
ncbi:ricin-type beta-trefoil lectin domain protein [Aestuariimicrobium sp. T2.26MG-19.2B]|uniref:ricin-type beta-trefoil lectin domain protein n=1 Tax=Aestuariimicrobium sp. T2.26MG-19.2B TaxID=3040679 RepID=UPI0024774785|nr:ricin-type beta-trefoil lectin domain protein [Aestuariimicrobium sp. T2.26MG-19.2B]CAI9403002.1 hypothetical protein AESSP_00916 [Aestuariimicrobium sp. T2.26MG-19.2B]